MSDASPPTDTFTGTDALQGQRRPPLIDAEKRRRVQHLLLEWFAVNRADLPWRHTNDAYAVLVSEFMLQQTQRDRVAPKFREFMATFPTLETLAEAPVAGVIRAWSGLGYNSRALRLHAIARRLCSSGIPRDVADLRALPGMGAYTAGAVACFGFGEQLAVVDTNVRRVLRRLLRGEPYPAPARRLDEELAAAALPEGRAQDWNAALMDLGALVCSSRGPHCEGCPLTGECASREFFDDAVLPPRLRRVAEAPAGYRRETGARASRVAMRYETTDRFVRGRIVEALRHVPDGGALDGPALALVAIGAGLPPQDERVIMLAERLVAEGLVAASTGEHGDRVYSLAE